MLPARRVATTYLDKSALPFTSLVFVAPLLFIYEVGTRLWAFDPVSQTEQRIIAFSKIQEFFRLFGVTGQFMPALAVVGILLSWHIARNDAWSVSFGTLTGMFVESFALALPLAAVLYAFAHYLPMMAGTGTNWPGLFILSIGAGIYEELVFRLVLVTLLHILLIDVLGMKGFWAGLLIVSVSSMGFAAYHYLGSEPFTMPSFAFRTIAGVYFAAVFLWRGFGVTVGAHAGYDVLIHAVQLLRAV
jgi:membrane protease YdiL (CAAX protease family)